MQINDRELLELAAKSIGLKARWFKVQQWRQVGHVKFADGKVDVFGTHHRKSWNPLTDDGDALRLASTLELEIQVFHGYGEVWADSLDGTVRGIADFTSDRVADYRLAIVRAAAEIGRAME